MKTQEKNAEIKKIKVEEIEEKEIDKLLDKIEKEAEEEFQGMIDDLRDEADDLENLLGDLKNALCNVYLEKDLYERGLKNFCTDYLLWICRFSNLNYIKDEEKIKLQEIITNINNKKYGNEYVIDRK